MEMVRGSVNVVLSASMTMISPMRDGMAGMPSPTATTAVLQAGFQCEKAIWNTANGQLQGIFWGKPRFSNKYRGFDFPCLKKTSTGCIPSFQNPDFL